MKMNVVEKFFVFQRNKILWKNGVLIGKEILFCNLNFEKFSVTSSFKYVCPRVHLLD